MQMEKDDYLQFFLNKKKPSSKTIYYEHINCKQQGSSHENGKKKDKKILPHISEEYQYKITNKLLVQKIMNPRRDKFIAQNFPRSFTREANRQQTRISKTGDTKTRSPDKIESLQRPYNHLRKQNSLSMHETIKQANDSKLQANHPKQNIFRLRQKVSKSHQKSFELALQNDRMGKRIINTKSSVQQILKKTYFTYKSHSHHKNSDKQNNIDLKSSFIRGNQDRKYHFTGKINNGVKVFFNKIKDDTKDNNIKDNKYKPNNSQKEIDNSTILQNQLDQTNNRRKQVSFVQRSLVKTSNCQRRTMIKSQHSSCLSQSKHVQTRYPESLKIFGRGPTIMMIYNLQIISNPPIKSNTLILFELITHEKRINFRKNKQKSIRTMPISYDFFQSQGQNNDYPNSMKFAINVSEIGDFVPLRLYKVNGVEIHQLGIIDINLSPYKYRKSEMDTDNQNFIKQFKINDDGEKVERDIVTSYLTGKLRKNRLNKAVDVEIKMEYKIYAKKFKNTTQKVIHFS